MTLREKIADLIAEAEERLSIAIDVQKMYDDGERDNSIMSVIRREDVQFYRAVVTTLRAAEENAENMRETLIWADLKIRSLPGTDQSDVEPIRQILGG